MPESAYTGVSVSDTPSPHSSAPSGWAISDRWPWWKTLNPGIYLISILPVAGLLILGGSLPGRTPSLLAAASALLLVQHAINVLNDCADWATGADRRKLGSWVRYHGGNTSLASRHGALSLLAGIGLGIATLWTAGRPEVLIFAAPFVVLGLLYNAGPRPLAYGAAGEWVTGLCYGPGVFGSLWLLAHPGISPRALLGCLAYGLLAASVLLSHQPPQIVDDALAGKRSFAVRHGAVITVRWTKALAVLALGLLAIAECPIGGDPLAVKLTRGAFTTGIALLILATRPTPAGLLTGFSLWHLSRLFCGGLP